jgi:hypothetical protein
MIWVEARAETVGGLARWSLIKRVCWSTVSRNPEQQSQQNNRDSLKQSNTGCYTDSSARGLTPFNPREFNWIELAFLVVGTKDQSHQVMDTMIPRAVTLTLEAGPNADPMLSAMALLRL